MKPIFSRILLLINLLIPILLFTEEKPLLFISTQLNPIAEATIMRNIILKNYKYQVNFQPYDDREIFNYLVKSDENADLLPDIIGGVYGDYINLNNKNLIGNINEYAKNLNENSINKAYIDMSKLDGKNYYFLPWMQATFIMVANKKALKYLPEKADINKLSYTDLIEWGKNIYKATKKNMIGFPLGQNGLMHRFLEGYIYPSYTKTMIINFNSPDAKIMWQDLKNLWQYVDNGSLTYNKMDSPLLNEDVWIAWDHSARLVNAFKEKSKDFIAFPAPIGPKGRGFITVLAGIGICKNQKYDPKVLDFMKYIISEKTQVITANNAGFFPVVNIGDIDKNNDIDKNIIELYKAINIQSNSKNGIISVIPSYFGDKSKDFDLIYLKTFSQIILRDKNIDEELKLGEGAIKKIFEETHAKNLPPDLNYIR